MGKLTVSPIVQCSKKTPLQKHDPETFPGVDTGKRKDDMPIWKPNFSFGSLNNQKGMSQRATLKKENRKKELQMQLLFDSFQQLV